MLAARRSFEGTVALKSMPRLCEALEQPEGECRYALEFDRGTLNVPYVEVRAQADLPLVCQRSLQRFLLPVNVVQRLALVASEEQEDALPEDYEALVLGAEGTIRPLDLIEDELILVLPVVPVDPDSEPVETSWPAPPDGGAGTDETATHENPFAVLASMKQGKQRDLP
ncbi:MAG TPA: YceD family protein [Xanthomonadaceae bacterium]|nr:YceD family protein [Xanthomonadaceae bacterium]